MLDAMTMNRILKRWWCLSVGPAGWGAICDRAPGRPTKHPSSETCPLPRPIDPSSLPTPFLLSPARRHTRKQRLNLSRSSICPAADSVQRPLRHPPAPTIKLSKRQHPPFLLTQLSLFTRSPLHPASETISPLLSSSAMLGLVALPTPPQDAKTDPNSARKPPPNYALPSVSGQPPPPGIFYRPSADPQPYDASGSSPASSIDSLPVSPPLDPTERKVDFEGVGSKDLPIEDREKMWTLMALYVLQSTSLQLSRCP